MIIWTTINSIGLLLVAIVLYLALRQIGLMLGRLGPVGARSTEYLSPRVGEYISGYTGGLSLPPNGLPTLYLFASASCSICGAVREAAQELMPHWRRSARIVMVYDKLPADTAPSGGPGLILSQDATLRTNLGIGFVPFGVLVDATEKVLARGLVNGISHVESLLEVAVRPHSAAALGDVSSTVAPVPSRSLDPRKLGKEPHNDES